jgi:hypothetical protein
MGEPLYEVVWPLGKSAYESFAPVQHVSDLTGKTVCELWDYLFRGEEIFPLLREGLRSQYFNTEFVDYSVFGNIHGGNEREVISALPELLRSRGCDVVISGIGA